MDFGVLGSLLVRSDGGGVRVVAGAKPRAILGVLLVGANRVVSVDRLLEEVWGDDLPASGLGALRYHISKLRDVLAPGRPRGEEGVIATVGAGYVLRLEPDEFDVWRFESLAEEGRADLAAGRFESAAEELSAALSLWRGGAFQDFTYDDFAWAEISRLEELRLVCLEDRIAADLAVARHREVLSELQGLTVQFPLRERFWSHLMVALYRSDQSAEALVAYRRARQMLGEQLGIEPNAALRRLEEQILLEEPALDLPRPDGSLVHNLPARVSVFVGRRDELVGVEKLVGEHRLVTLTGVGGVGKTSLAVEAGRRLVGTFPDGVWLVELAALSAPDQVVVEIARILDVGEDPRRSYLESVVDAVGERRLMLLIDNCEHVVKEVGVVADALLRACPGLKVLATSREPLHIEGEQVWSLPPLGVPADQRAVSATQARETDAVLLFVERAGKARASFDLDEGNVADVAAICCRLDGIPLALELAAARIAVLSPRQILDRLDDRYAFLVHGPQTQPARHQTLRATMEWSHDLLGVEERTLLRRLSVFHGGCTLEAVEAVCSDGLVDRAVVLDLVGRLVDTSLLTLSGGEAVRYGMLDTVRHFALDRLEEDGEATALRRRHARYYAALAEPGDDDIFSEERAEQYRQLGVERPNLLAALEWAYQEGGADLLLGMTADLGMYWYVLNRLDEARPWLLRALEVSSSKPTLRRAIVLWVLGAVYLYGNLLEEAESAAREVARIAELLGDVNRAGDAIFLRGQCAEAAGDLKEARRLGEKHARLLRRADHPQMSLPLVWAALLSVDLGDVASASRLASEAEEQGKRFSQAWVLAQVAGVRGSIAHLRGDLPKAELLLSQAVAELRRLGWVHAQTDHLGSLAAVAIAMGRLEQAEEWALDLGEVADVLPEYASKVESLALRARVALVRGEISVGRGLAQDALEIGREIRDRLTVAAQVGWATGDAERAAVVHAGAARLRRITGYVLPAPRAHEIERELVDIRTSLGEEVYAAAWVTGDSMDPADVVEYAQEMLAAW